MIDKTVAFGHVHIGYSRGSWNQGRRQLCLEAHMKVTSSLDCSLIISEDHPEDLTGIEWPL